MALSLHYPPAYTDFYGTSTPCIYKNGAPWPVRPEAQPYIREVRPVSFPDSVKEWHSLLHAIGGYLDTLQIKFTFIDPLAYANAGEALVFCPLVVVIGVKPTTVSYQSAVEVVTKVAKMLSSTDFAKAEVAVVEGERVRQALGPMLLPFNPLLDEVPEQRKLFSSTLGLAIAPHKHPHYAGTGSLYYQLGPEKRLLLLTCAHVARPPPPVSSNAGITITNTSQRREEIISPGSGAFDAAVKGVKAEIAREARSIDAWEGVITRLGAPSPTEAPVVTRRRAEHRAFIDGAVAKIGHLNDLLNSVEDRSDPDKRIIGFVLHCEPIEVSFGPRGYTKDWALIEINKDMIHWESFPGNKIFVGASLSLILFDLILTILLYSYTHLGRRVRRNNVAPARGFGRLPVPSRRAPPGLQHRQRG
jgi:hypothetical protein